MQRQLLHLHALLPGGPVRRLHHLRRRLLSTSIVSSASSGAESTAPATSIVPSASLLRLQRGRQRGRLRRAAGLLRGVGSQLTGLGDQHHKQRLAVQLERRDLLGRTRDKPVRPNLPHLILSHPPIALNANQKLSA